MQPLLRVVTAVLAVCAPLNAMAVTHKTVYNDKVKPAKHSQLKASKHPKAKSQTVKSSVKDHVNFDRKARQTSRQTEFGVHKEN